MKIQNYKIQKNKSIESGLYIHIPFCRKKCIYCDFFSGGTRDTDWPRYLNAIINELRERINELRSEPETLYIGGGTPSLIPSDYFGKFISDLNKLIKKNTEWREFTIEVNPEDVNTKNCEIWNNAGVNRISIGIQSLVNKELQTIGRAYDNEKALKSLETLQSYFENVTVDIIFGLPGQSFESWKFTVEEILRHHPTHISAYSLMFEEGTPLTVMRNQGRLSFPDEDECIKMWEWLISKLNDSGYNQYELSNYSLPGYEAIHNSRYWLGNPYLGLGPSAHSYDGVNIRRSNPNNINGYMKRFSSSKDLEKSLERAPLDTSSEYNKREGKDSWKPFYIGEKLKQEELMEEKIMLCLRMTRGLDLEEFGKEYGQDSLKLLLEKSRKFLQEEELIINNDRLALTKKGIMMADNIILNICP